MDILNQLPEKQFDTLDDLLAFVSIYDDERRTEAFNNLIKRYKKYIQGKVVVDAGCGFGLFSEAASLLGAEKIYAVEANAALYDIACQRLENIPNIELVNQDIRHFSPPKQVSVLIQEFFGQLLYDEDIYCLNQLKFTPDLILPNQARLMATCVNSEDYVDDTVTQPVLSQIDGALIAGLFDDEPLEFDYPVIHWSPATYEYHTTFELKTAGDLVVFALQILDQDKVICQAGQCENWAYVWTPRRGNRFSLRFHPGERGSTVDFYWID